MTAKKKKPMDETPPEPKVQQAGTRWVPIDELHNDPANVRLHDAKNLAAIKGSLQQFGQVEPLVVQKGTGKVIGGNGRLEALRELGVKNVAVWEVEANDVQATALGIALNRTGELAKWDYQNLSKLMQSLQASEFDLGSIGWEDTEVLNLLSADWKPPALEDLEEGGHGEHAPTIQLTVDQREVFERAAARVKAISGDEAISDGRCVELICADYLAGHA